MGADCVGAHFDLLAPTEAAPLEAQQAVDAAQQQPREQSGDLRGIGCGRRVEPSDSSLVKPLPRLPFDGAVDSDGHVLEPPDPWQRYLEPAYRARAVTVRPDEAGREYLEIDGRVSKLVRGGMPAGLGAMDAAERLARLDLENPGRSARKAAGTHQ